MLKTEREREVIEILRETGGFVSTGLLCERLFASASSVRRDLCSLEKEGIVRRVHGGAELCSGLSHVVGFPMRSHHNTEAKKAIAKKAAALVNDGDVVFLDPSSTTYYLAEELLLKNGLTVVTNSLEILSLMSRTSFTVLSSGGILSRENRTCFVGDEAAAAFSSVHADLLFFSSHSLSADGTIWDVSREEVLVRHDMLKNAAKKYFLCDSEKFDTFSAYRQCALSEVDGLICENESGQSFRDAFPHLAVW